MSTAVEIFLIERIQTETAYRSGFSYTRELWEFRTEAITWFTQEIFHTDVGFSIEPYFFTVQLFERYLQTLDKSKIPSSSEGHIIISGCMLLAKKYISSQPKINKTIIKKIIPPQKERVTRGMAEEIWKQLDFSVGPDYSIAVFISFFREMLGVGRDDLYVAAFISNLSVFYEPLATKYKNFEISIYSLLFSKIVRLDPSLNVRKVYLINPLIEGSEFFQTLVEQNLICVSTECLDAVFHLFWLILSDKFSHKIEELKLRVHYSEIDNQVNLFRIGESQKPFRVVFDKAQNDVCVEILERRAKKKRGIRK